MVRSDNVRRPNLIEIGHRGRVLAGAVPTLSVAAAATATTVAASAWQPAEALALTVAGIVLLIAGAATDAAARWRSGTLGLVAVPLARSATPGEDAHVLRAGVGRGAAPGAVPRVP